MKNIVTIRDSWGKVLYRGDHENIALAIEHCARAGIPLRGALLNNLDLSGADIAELKASGANFSHTTFKKAKCFGVDFSGCNLNYTNFENADVRCADFSHATGFNCFVHNTRVDPNILFFVPIKIKAIPYANTKSYLCADGEIYTVDEEKSATHSVSLNQ